MKTERYTQQHDLRNATPEEKREVILEILDENPSVSNKRIEELTGISKSTVWTIRQTLEHEFAVQNTSMFGDVTMFGNEKEVEEFIREHSSLFFGEVIEWIDDWNLYGESGSPITPDLVGRNASGEFVIVEVKMLRNDATRYDRAREAIGQVLHYLHASVAELVNPVAREDFLDPTEEQLAKLPGMPYHLYIIGAYHSPTVENVCNLLRAHGINIQHLSIQSLPQAI